MVGRPPQRRARRAHAPAGGGAFEARSGPHQRLVGMPAVSLRSVSQCILGAVTMHICCSRRGERRASQRMIEELRTIGTQGYGRLWADEAALLRKLHLTW